MSDTCAIAHARKLGVRCCHAQPCAAALQALQHGMRRRACTHMMQPHGTCRGRIPASHAWSFIPPALLPECRCTHALCFCLHRPVRASLVANRNHAHCQSASPAAQLPLHHGTAHRTTAQHCTPAAPLRASSQRTGRCGRRAAAPSCPRCTASEWDRQEGSEAGAAAAAAAPSVHSARGAGQGDVARSVLGKGVGEGGRGRWQLECTRAVWVMARGGREVVIGLGDWGCLEAHCTARSDRRRPLRTSCGFGLRCRAAHGPLTGTQARGGRLLLG